MTWKIITKRSFGKRSLDIFDTASVVVNEGSEFVTVEDTVNPDYKKATTVDGLVLYIPSSALAEVND